MSFLQFIAPGLLAVTAMNAVTFDTCFEGYDRLHRTGTYTAMTSSGILYARLGLVVVSQARSHEHLFYYFTLVVTPMFMFSGVFFPVDRLPEGLPWVVRRLPLYHVVEMNRALVLMIAAVAPFPAPLMKRALEKL